MQIGSRNDQYVIEKKTIRYALKKKNDIIWEFFSNVGPPPPPPFGNPLSKKKILCLFCILEHKEHL